MDCCPSRPFGSSGDLFLETPNYVRDLSVVKTPLKSSVVILLALAFAIADTRPSDAGGLLRKLFKGRNTSCCPTATTPCSAPAPCAVSSCDAPAPCAVPSICGSPCQTVCPTSSVGILSLDTFCDNCCAGRGLNCKSKCIAYNSPCEPEDWECKIFWPLLRQCEPSGPVPVPSNPSCCN